MSNLIHTSADVAEAAGATVVTAVGEFDGDLRFLDFFGTGRLHSTGSGNFPARSPHSPFEMGKCLISNVLPHVCRGECTKCDYRGF